MILADVYFTGVDEDRGATGHKTGVDASDRCCFEVSSVKSIDILEKLMIEICNRRWLTTDEI